MDRTRVNHHIRKSPVRLIDHDGAQVGVVPIEEARKRAEAVGLDLVEVGSNSDPPVVKVLDWGKLKYEREKQAREARKKTHTIEVKEVKYRPNIDKHDMDRKTDRIKTFLKKGKKVKVTVFFRYRQLRRPELGTEILDFLTVAVEDLGVIESRTQLEARRMVMVIAPLPQDKREAAAKAAQAAEPKNSGAESGE
ncbi:MAG: translation initiation factor IF-3 [Acidobacteria bacterium]|nr:translation initiation factor IF-3 [Acidobacteriota bacterium]